LDRNSGRNEYGLKQQDFFTYVKPASIDFSGLYMGGVSGPLRPVIGIAHVMVLRKRELLQCREVGSGYCAGREAVR